MPLYANPALLRNKAGLFRNKAGLLGNKEKLIPSDFGGGSSFVVGAAIYIGGSNNKQKSFRGE
jgi:hypothetical protein